jgi:hypothetical protein
LNAIATCHWDMLKLMLKVQYPRCVDAQPQAGSPRDLCKNLMRDGGADRDRTDDILLAKQALSQLSYSPIVDQYN